MFRRAADAAGPEKNKTPDAAWHPGFLNFRAACRWPLRSRSALPGPKLPVAADLHDAVALADRHAGEHRTREGERFGAEIVIVVFDEQRQVAHHRIFDAAAGRPTRTRCADHRRRQRAAGGKGVVSLALPGAARLRIGKPAVD